MREILFRGKQEYKNKEWAFGSLHSEYGETDKNGQRKIDYRILGMRGECDYVLPETVGQFTGLTDKNGKKIFEGDIVEGHCHSQWRHELQRCEVAYGRDGFEARHHVVCGGEQRYYTYKVLFSKDVVVIGNIHDNPELLGGAEDGKTENR
jgi:uncharacterized phage protein (TIGR01671 family)